MYFLKIKHSQNSKTVVVHYDNIKPYRGKKQNPARSDTEHASAQLKRVPVTHRRAAVSGRRQTRLKILHKFPPGNPCQQLPASKIPNQREDQKTWHQIIPRPIRLFRRDTDGLYEDHCDFEELCENMRCGICGRTFSRISNLNLHMKKQHEGEIDCLKCSFCQRTFVRSFNLKKHYRDIHRLEWKNLKRAVEYKKYRVNRQSYEELRKPL